MLAQQQLDGLQRERLVQRRQRNVVAQVGQHGGVDAHRREVFAAAVDHAVRDGGQAASVEPAQHLGADVRQRRVVGLLRVERQRGGRFGRGAVAGFGGADAVDLAAPRGQARQRRLRRVEQRELDARRAAVEHQDGARHGAGGRRCCRCWRGGRHCAAPARWRTSIRAMAQEAMRLSRESDRLVSMIGTRAPMIRPALAASPMYSSCLASILPLSRSGTTSTSARPATSETMPLTRAAAAETALSKASGPSSTAPVIWPRSAILHSAAASSVAAMRGLMVSTAARMATRGVATPMACASSMALRTMSALSARLGAMLMAASVRMKGRG